MTPRARWAVAGLMILVPGLNAAAGQADLRVGASSLWAKDIGSANSLVCAGDIDGKGFSELATIDPAQGGSMSWVLNDGGRAGRRTTNLLAGQIGSPIAAACGEIDGRPGDEIALLYRSGVVRTVSGLCTTSPRIRHWGLLPIRDVDKAWLAIVNDPANELVQSSLHGGLVAIGDDGALVSATWKVPRPPNPAPAWSGLRRVPLSLPARPVEVVMAPEPNVGCFTVGTHYIQTYLRLSDGSARWQWTNPADPKRETRAVSPDLSARLAAHLRLHPATEVSIDPAQFAPREAGSLLGGRLSQRTWLELIEIRARDTTKSLDAWVVELE